VSLSRRNTEYVNSFLQPPGTQLPLSHSSSSLSLPASSPPLTNNPADLDPDLLAALELSKLEYTSSTGDHFPAPPATTAPQPSPGMVGYARPSPTTQQPTNHQFESYTSPLHTQLPLVSRPPPSAAPPPSNPFHSYAFDQEESDRLQALALQEEFHRQVEEMSHEQYIHGSRGGGGGDGTPQSSAEIILGKKINSEELERYKEAERQYLSSLQQHGGPPPPSSSRGGGRGGGGRGPEAAPSMCAIQ
jgi:hypothetical protein